jgi:hypothetical protein
VLQFEEMINSDLHLHFRSETHFRYEGEFYIVETVTRFLSTPIGQRDEKLIEVMSGTRYAARTYDLETGALVSDELWDKIILARNEMGAFITTIALQMPKESTALDYAKTMITAYRNNGTTPHQVASEALATVSW